jgi:hypothetical protein
MPGKAVAALIKKNLVQPSPIFSTIKPAITPVTLRGKAKMLEKSANCVAENFLFVCVAMKATKAVVPSPTPRYTRECLALRTGYSLKSDAVMDVLTDLFITRGIPDHIRSDILAVSAV